MKNFTTFAVVMVVVGVLASLTPSSLGNPVARAVPMEDIDTAPAPRDVAFDIPSPQQEERSGRYARATCDLLSFQSKWVTPNHAACAAHCLALMRGFKGGRCQNAVCVCRK